MRIHRVRTRWSEASTSLGGVAARPHAVIAGVAFLILLTACASNVSEMETRTRDKETGTFLVFVVQWTTVKHDVDLHVIDPAGEEFSYRKSIIPGRPGELSVDTTMGPGVEIWEVADALPGKYQVLYNLFDRKGNTGPAVVMGRLFHRNGNPVFRKRSLTREGRQNAVLAVVVTVGDDGSVGISEP